MFLGAGAYIWFNGKQAYSIDEENKTAKILDQNKTIGIVYKESFASLYPGYTDNLFGRIMLAGNLSNKIKTKYFNGEKCIVIEIKEEKCTKTFWINENFKNLVQSKIEFTNGDVYEYKYDIKFHTTKLKDVELPDISEYTVVDDSTEDEVETNTLENDVKLQTQNVVVENITQNTPTEPVG